MRAGIKSFVLAVAGVSTLSACSGDYQVSIHEGGVEMRPDLMELASDTVTPGGTAEVRFPEETPRGVAWSLEAKVEEGWHIEFLMTGSSGAIGGESNWVSVDDAEDFGWIDIGVMGGGPDIVPIPENAEPGEYRLCTANSAPNVCTELTVQLP